MYEYKLLSVKSVYDGDTFIGVVDLGFGVNKVEKFRLSYINAPELRGDTLDEARVSRLWLIGRLNLALDNDDLVVIKTTKDRKGKYGRYLGEIIINGVSVNQEMLDKGLAVKYE